MLEKLFVGPATRARVRRGTVGRHLDRLAANLFAAGYARSTVRKHVYVAAAFGRWLDQHQIDLGEVSEHLCERYLAERDRNGPLNRSRRACLRLLLIELRAAGVLETPAVCGDQSPATRLLERFGAHLRADRGLASSTVSSYSLPVRQFIEWRFSRGHLAWHEVRPSDVSGFLLDPGAVGSTARAKMAVTALRALFRFLLRCGEITVNLAKAVPAVASWRSTGLPKYLHSDQVERVLASCDPRTATGSRDHAVLIMIARLGLRAGEIVALELDDIDWRAGELLVPGKGLVRDRLPLPTDVGTSLTAYLCQGRPVCKTRRVFVRAKAPHTGFVGASAVSTITRRALDRCGIDSATRGAHLLRHSLATGMLRNCASMAEIAELLRHRAPGTTEIYAKVHIDALRSVAQPWPGRGGAR